MTIQICCRVLEQVNFEKKFSSLPQFKPEECQSPSAISVPSSPRVFVQNYRKKQAQAVSVDDESESEPPSSANLKSGAKLIGTTFFGPDFNVESFKGNNSTLQRKCNLFDNLFLISCPEMNESGDCISPKTPKTPSTSTTRDAEKGHRRMLEQRRNLVMQLFQEHGFFPSQQATSNFQVSCGVCCEWSVLCVQSSLTPPDLFRRPRMPTFSRASLACS